MKIAVYKENPYSLLELTEALTNFTKSILCKSL